MRLSLAGRLTVLYAGLAPLLVAGAMLVQYRTLVTSLADEDDRLLEATLEVARQALPARATWQVAEQPDNPIVRLLDAQCRQTTPPWTGAPPASCPEASDSGTHFRSWRPPGGPLWRIAARRVNASGGGWIEAVLDRASDEAVLSTYRARLGLVLLLTTLGSALLGYGVTRHGLRPLGELADRVARVDARSLNQRLTPADAPAEIRRLTASFDGMLVRLDAAFTSLTEFSADLAHELRTPIHILRQQAEVALQRARTTEEYREVLSTSLEELERLGRMIEETLFLAHAEDPRATIRYADLNLQTECESVAEFLSALAEDRGVELIVEVERGLRLAADRTLFRRALVNGLTNAIRHAPSGGRVQLRAAVEGKATVLEIRDTGEGIPPEALPRVFDRHFRNQRREGPDAGGAGLGLPIVRGIMHLHRGEAAIITRLGEGTTLRLVFPPNEHAPIPDKTVI